jgi:hypothetical protein
MLAFLLLSQGTVHIVVALITLE